jgi:hypothetical protein
VSFGDLPNEIIDLILNLLPYKDMHRLKAVSSEWKDSLTFLIAQVSWKRISNELDLIIIRDDAIENLEYNWFLSPKNTILEPCSLPQLYGISQIEYTYGYPNLVQSCDFYNSNDEPNVLREKRTKWCDIVLTNHVGKIQYKLMKNLTFLFMKEQFDIYNEHYPVKLSFGENIVPLILVKKTNNLLKIQFTSDGFMINEENRKEHDFKLFKSKNDKKAWVWQGLGDRWQTMTVKEILQCFSPVQKENGQIAFNLLSLNHESNTISHLFEAILYIVDCILDSKKIKWE